MKMLVWLLLNVVNCTAKKVRRKKGVIQDTPTSSPVKPKVKSPTKSPTSPIPKSKKSAPKEASASPPKKKRKTIEDDQSDSDMSVLNDSTPPTTKPRKQTTKDPSRATKPTPKSSNTIKPVTSSSEDEIKHLKSLVFKCGVRKNWYFVFWCRLIVGPKNSRRRCPHQNKSRI